MVFVGRKDELDLLPGRIGVPPGPALAEQLTAAGGNPRYLRELIDALVRESRLNLALVRKGLPAIWAVRLRARRDPRNE